MCRVRWVTVQGKQMLTQHLKRWPSIGIVGRQYFFSDFLQCEYQEYIIYYYKENGK